MAVSTEKIHQIIKGGVQRFVKPYKVPAETIQIVFSLNPEGGVKFFTCIRGILKNTVQLKDLMGATPWNYVIKQHIEALLNRLSVSESVSTDEINLLSGISVSGEVYFQIRKNQELVRVITDPDELK